MSTLLFELGRGHNLVLTESTTVTPGSLGLGVGGYDHERCSQSQCVS